MSDATQASILIKQIVPRDHRSVKEWLIDTYRRLHKTDDRWSYPRALSIWYESARRIDAWEMDAIRHAIEINEVEKQDAAQQIEAAKAEFRELLDLCDRQKRSMHNTDADFFGPSLNALDSFTLKVARFIAPEISGDD